MCEDPPPNADPNEKFYGGDNQYRLSGQPLEFKQLNIHAWEAFENGQDIHMQAWPSQSELLCKNYTIIEEKLKGCLKETIMEKYGNVATEEMRRQLLLGQSDIVRSSLNMTMLEESYKAWRHLFLKASLRKMCTLITTQVFGAPVGRITSGAINAVSRQLKIFTALELLELRLLKQQQI